MQSPLNSQNSWDESVADKRREDVLRIARRMDQLLEEQKALEDEQFDLQIWGIQAAATSYEALAEYTA